MIFNDKIINSSINTNASNRTKYYVILIVSEVSLLLLDK